MEKTYKIAREKAKWVYTLTDYFTIDLMYNLAKVLISRSKSAAGKENLFHIP